MHPETFCLKTRCNCHEHHTNIIELWTYYWEGLITFENMLSIFRGLTLYGW